MPEVIFLTAYDQFALRSFAAEALDYLVKPVSKARFAAAIERLPKRLQTTMRTTAHERLVVSSASGAVAKLTFSLYDWHSMMPCVGTTNQSCLRQFINHTTLTVIRCGTALLLALLPAYAQQLSVRHYDASDGLANSHVSAIQQDAKGYLWFGTREGLSRFDGYRFINYSTREGLGNPVINALAEDRQGHLWIGTNGGGVARLLDEPQESFGLSLAPTPSKRKFVSYQVGDSPASNRVNALVFDASNNLWCVTDGGLYRGMPSNSGDLKFEIVVPHRTVATEMAAYADSHGRLWFGIETELIEVVQNQLIKYGPADEVGHYQIQCVIEDRQGRLLVANKSAVFEFSAPTDGQSRGRWQRLPLAFKPEDGIFALHIDSAGALWIGTLNGLVKCQDGRQTVYTTAQGLSDNFIRALAEDRDGNLWIGSEGGGVCKLAGELIVSYTKTEGLPNNRVLQVVEDQQGRIYASVSYGGLVEIRAEKAVPLAGSQAPPFKNSFLFPESPGDWWIATTEGWLCFRGADLQLRHGTPLAPPAGVSAASFKAYVVLHEVQAGKLWAYTTDGNLYRLDLARQGRAVFEHLPVRLIPPFNETLLLTSDRSQALWLGVHYGGIGRIVKGQIEALQPTAGLPETDPRAFFLDSRGWLWIGLRYKGVSMTKDPSAETPKFVNYSTANGLVSDTVWSIAEDDFGRIYLGTGKGLDQLDPVTGRIHHFNTKDGLASDLINHCFKDHKGNIWVANSLGLSKFDPRAERHLNLPPPIYLSRVQVAGEEQPLSETGALRVPEFTLPAAHNNLLIEYVALSFQGEQKLRYQYKLEGVDTDWSAPSEVRSVNYARLAPGAYRFLARAINQEGGLSPAPASLQFQILPPLWQRWWFLTLAGLLGGLAAYTLYRYRVARLIELERVRTRIATDLHDDIGSSLSQISVLSEVIHQRLGQDLRVTEPLTLIAELARGLVDSLNDIVWAINPTRDRLSDLTYRMRRFASDVFTARDIAFDFSAPGPPADIKLGADTRREVFLIFKESVNNLLRHAACTKVEIEFIVEARQLILRVSDNGQGFDPEQASDGNGLTNMRQRALKLGGRLEISSSQGAGATVKLNAPLGRR
ncbi:MAG: hypothetical protein HY011_23135 [Acidobacteria bacterium]|nr:hypothetical protein [Acidobacteriota bacterium]